MIFVTAVATLRARWPDIERNDMTNTTELGPIVDKMDRRAALVLGVPLRHRSLPAARTLAPKARLVQ
jgi:hypothetical protein